jgi:hypothetical protein
MSIRYEDYTGAFGFAMSSLIYDPNQRKQDIYDAESYPFTDAGGVMNSDTLYDAIREAFSESHTEQTISDLTISISSEAYAEAGTSPALSLSDGNELRQAIAELSMNLTELKNILKDGNIID